MAYTWGPIDADTDIFDIGLFNIVQAAAHERVLAGARTQNINHGSYYGHTLEIAAALQAKEAGYPMAKASSLVTSAGLINYYGVTPTVGNQLQCTLLDLQNRLADASYNFIKDTTSVPTDFTTWNPALLAAAIGYPIGSASSGYYYGLWRRKCPRRVYNLSATYSQDFFGTYYSGGYYYPATVNYGPLEVGNRAQYYVADTSMTFQAYRVPGNYAGVWEYRGSGTWIKCPGGTEPDTLDSSADWQSNTWTFPGTFQIGDYYGWWLWRDIYEVCKRLKWTTTGGIYHAPSNGFNGYYDVRRGDTTANYTSAGAAQAAAVADFGSSPDYYSFFTPSPVWASWYTGSGTSWGAYTQSSQVDLLADNYQGLSRTVDYYVKAQPVVPVISGGTPSEFDNVGMGFGNGVFGLYESKAFGSTAHDYLYDAASRVSADWRTPSFGAAPGFRGAYIQAIQAVTRWNFSVS